MTHDNVEQLMQEADIYLKDSNFSEAMEAYTKAPEVEPTLGRNF